MTQTEDVVEATRTVLGSDLIGAYLHGSTALDAMQWRSDLDILVVTQRRLTKAQRTALAQALLPISGRSASWPEVRPVELTVVAQPEVRPWRFPPRREFQYGEWLRKDTEAGVVQGPVKDPDLALLLTMTLRADRAVFGPPPAEVLGPVPFEDVQHAAIECVPGLFLDIEGDTANVLLTFARVWVTLATGDIVSKDAAADWALARLPAEAREPLERARAIYLGEHDDSGWEAHRSEVRACAQSIAAEISSQSTSINPGIQIEVGGAIETRGRRMTTELPHETPLAEPGCER